MMHPMAEHPLISERSPSTADGRYSFARREAVYRFAGHHCDARRVLDLIDVGCGEGYGSALLAQRAAWVLGVSADEQLVTRAQADYPVVRYDTINADGALPCADAAVDVAVCCDLSSPLWETDRLLTELFRVLRPGGQLVCAAPNRRDVVSGLRTPPVEPAGPARGVSAAELLDLVAPRFKLDTLLGLHHGWRLAGVERLLGHSLPDLVRQNPPLLWPRWVRSTVHRVHPSDFCLRADRVDEALDLVALATRR